MKKTSLLFVALCLLFASCGKDPENEWSRFYGFTQADIIGHYEANPDESLYEELPVEGVAVYNNASLDVNAIGETAISVHIIIPDIINKTFSGPINMQYEDHSDITMTNGLDIEGENLMMTVNKNKQGQVRFHGRVKHPYYNYANHQHDYYNWGFDVIKEE